MTPSPSWMRRPRPADATRRWAHNLAGVTEQLVTDDPQFRKLLHTGPGFSQEVSRLLNQLKPTLPVLLANLTTIGQIGVTYHPSLEQLLVLLPPDVAAYSSYGVTSNPTGLAVGGFTLTIADPPACTVGFLPPSQWRSPADLDTDRHSRQSVLQTSARLPHRRARRPQQSVHGPPRKAGPDRRDLQQRQAL